jgi:hypothetical protein
VAINQCRTCGGLGHWASTCPQNKLKQNIADVFKEQPQTAVAVTPLAITDGTSGKGDAGKGKGKNKGKKGGGKPKGAKY